MSITIDNYLPAQDLADVSISNADENSRSRIVKQVEFYFGDSNLPYDRFMWKLHSSTAEHWVPISTLATFKRMQEFAEGESALKWIAECLATSDLLEVNDSGTNVRRRTKVKELTGQFERLVHVSGFGTTEAPDLLTHLINFFESYAPTTEVRMQRNRQDKSFQGAVFVEFSDIFGVDTFLNADPKPTWNGVELLALKKSDYIRVKREEMSIPAPANLPMRPEILRSFNAFKVPISQGGLAPENQKPRKKIWFEHKGKKMIVERDDGGNGVVNPDAVPFVPGSTLKFEGVGTEKFSWDEMRKPLKMVLDGRVPYISHTVGQNFGYVGFNRALSTEDFEHVRYAVYKINGKDIRWSQIDANEERSFQFRRVQAKARAALRYADENPHRGPNFGRPSSNRPGRGNGVVQVRAPSKRQVTRSMTATHKAQDSEQNDLIAITDPYAGIYISSAPSAATYTSSVITASPSNSNSAIASSPHSDWKRKRTTTMDVDLCKEEAITEFLTSDRNEAAVDSASAAPKKKKIKMDVDIAMMAPVLSSEFSIKTEAENVQIPAAADTKNVKEDDPIPEAPRKSKRTTTDDGTMSKFDRASLSPSLSSVATYVKVEDSEIVVTQSSSVQSKSKEADPASGSNILKRKRARTTTVNTDGQLVMFGPDSLPVVQKTTKVKPVKGKSEALVQVLQASKKARVNA